MGDVDDLQVAEEKAAQRAQEQAAKRRERSQKELRQQPQRPGFALTTMRTEHIPLAQLHPGDNIRLDLPDIQELALSIREVGLLTPLLVRPWNDDSTADGALPKAADSALPQFRLVAGHRRFAALNALADADVDGFDAPLCEIRDGLSEAEAYALMLTENVQRVPLEPIQAARALRLLLDLNDGMDVATLARGLGLRPAWATTHLKLLELPQEVQDRLEAGDLSVTLADMLRRGQSTGRVNDEQVKEIARKVASGEITTAEARKQAGPPPKPNTAAPTTVRDGDAGSGDGTWQPMSDSAARGDDLPRPATPLSGAPRENPYATGDAIQPVSAASGSGETPAATAAQQTGAAQVVPWEDRLDAYLLGRALREWAADEYLDELGIDRVQADSYAMMLGFEERIAAIRHLSATLMDAENAVVPA